MSRARRPALAPHVLPRCGSAAHSLRPFCCHRSATLEATLTLPPHEGGTVCELRVFGSCPYRTVEIHERVDNPGAPSGASLDSIAAWVRDGLLLCRHEPTWLQHEARPGSPRATRVPAAHRLWRADEEWLRRPLTRVEYGELLRRSRWRAVAGHLPPYAGPHPW